MKYLRILLLMSLWIACEAGQMRAKFIRRNNNYICKMSRQTYPAESKNVRVFGRHLKHKVKGRSVVYTNEDVRVFDASYSKNIIPVIPTVVFRLFPNLDTMLLQDIGLKTIQRGAFQNCKSLKSIYFADDEIQTIDAGVFSNCTNLVSLNFTNNAIRSLDEGAFQGLTQLDKLVLRKNQLKTLSEKQFISNKNLHELEISYQLLESLPVKIFSELTKLNVLNLDNNHLVKIPSEFFFGKPFLRSVDLSHNQIANIDRKIIKSWPNRATLNLLSNKCFSGDLGRIDKITRVSVEMKLTKCFIHENPKLAGKSTRKPSTGKNSTKSSNEKKSMGKKTIQKKKLFEHDNQVHDNDSSGDLNIDDVKGSKAKKQKILDKIKHSIFGSSEKNEKKNSTKPHHKDNKTITTPTINNKRIVPTKMPLPKGTIKGNHRHMNGTKIITTPRKVSRPMMKPTRRTPVISNRKTTPKPVKVVPKLKNAENREEAIARFYVNAKNEYTGVVKDATRFLKNINLKHIAGYQNENVTVVFFIKSNLINIPKVIFKTFPNVKKISAANCGIQIMDNDLFEECGKLQVLDLSGNKIRTVIGNSLQQCSMLELVNLSKNKVERIESNIFQCNPKLHIHLDGLKIVPPAQKTK